MGSGVREGAASVFVIVLFGLMVFFGAETTQSMDEKKGCIQGVCPITCCRKPGGMDCCCVTFSTHACKCGDMPPPAMVEDEDG